MRKALIAATYVVWLHVAVVILHSAAHLEENVLPATFFDYAFVVVVILIAPVAALLLLNTLRLSWPGALLLFLSMLGSLLYGLVNHFLIPGADNAIHMSPGGWQLPFLVTSYLLLVFEAAGSVIGVCALFARKDYKTA